MKKIRKRTILLLLSLWGFVAYVASVVLVQRREPDVKDSPLRYDMAYEQVTFFSHRDRIQLVGWWIPAENSATNGTIIQCHGQNGSMDGDLETAKMLHDCGYNVFMFDFRAHGRSEGSKLTFGLKEADDIRGAIDYIASYYHVQQVGILAFSMGTLAALRSATTDQRVKTMVLDGTVGDLSTTLRQWLLGYGVPLWFAYPFVWTMLFFAEIHAEAPLFQINSIEWISSVQNASILFIHGAVDDLVSLRTVQQIRVNAQSETDLWLAEGCKHREAYKKYPEIYKEKLHAWFNKHLTGAVV